MQKYQNSFRMEKKWQKERQKKGKQRPVPKVPRKQEAFGACFKDKET